MTNEDWKLIVRAWAAWVNGEGPLVQGRKHGCARTGQWVEWDDRDRLDKRNYDEWRVKPPQRLARICCEDGFVKVCTKAPDEPTPSLRKGVVWLGDWQEIPE